MTERYEDIIVNGEVVGQRLVADAVPEAPRRWITRLAFRNRFTTAELVALEIAGLDVATALPAARQLAASIRVMQRQVSEATYIDLDRPDTRAGVQQLEAANLLGAVRAPACVVDPVPPVEVPQ